MEAPATSNPRRGKVAGRATAEWPVSRPQAFRLGRPPGPSYKEATRGQDARVKGEAPLTTTPIDAHILDGRATISTGPTIPYQLGGGVPRKLLVKALKELGRATLHDN